LTSGGRIPVPAAGCQAQEEVLVGEHQGETFYCNFCSTHFRESAPVHFHRKVNKKFYFALKCDFKFQFIRIRILSTGIIKVGGNFDVQSIVYDFQSALFHWFARFS
jgi:hypothetical protein